MTKDVYWMKRALVLARKGLGTTFPNPMVGAIVLDSLGQKVGQGYHFKAGESHAETIALEQAGEKSKGGTLYVTLEPCCHTGRTPPCTEAIIKSGIQKVVMATPDQNPLVKGLSTKILAQHGITVKVGCLQSIAEKINRVFFNWIVHQRPYVVAKVAVTQDFKMGTRDSRLLISDPMMERTTMKLRKGANVLMVGVGTVLTDNPKLTARSVFEHPPTLLRAILDPGLKTPVDAQLFKSSNPVWIFYDENHRDLDHEKVRVLSKQARLICLKARSGGIFDPKDILKCFDHQLHGGILIEGGLKTLSHFHDAHLIDEWVIYISHKRFSQFAQKSEALSLAFQSPFHLLLQSAIRRARDLEVVATNVYRDH
ncbi:MAG: bifunctional diaminohydroxyphosphoribosylaminopyrimidine deaminase/5-amino-6-(5-phosphoribosylamino)uracil reductase RibD [Bdellovibrionales bacterium]|nr:bifunctional diaminohydroxyphosphoribosylaminopyrimidine deaminase/5-amino-6-(5-phosphoribosylamino)uracil reductase RibD [Bdellovibrionales bacterium]